MSILKIYGGQALQKALDEITGPVQVTYHALDHPEPEVMVALDTLMSLTPFLSATIESTPDAEADRVIVKRNQKPGMVFFGPPVGTELAALLSAIVVAGRGCSGLLPKTQQALAQFAGPVHLDVFTTPTWPGCAQAVSLAHKFAFENPHITAEAISCVAVPELAQHYKVLGTPHTVVNGERHLKGRFSEEHLLEVIAG